MSDQALYADYVADGLNGFMDFEELRTHLFGLLEFPTDLVVENEREPDWDLKHWRNCSRHENPTTRRQSAVELVNCLDRLPARESRRLPTRLRAQPIAERSWRPLLRGYPSHSEAPLHMA